MPATSDAATRDVYMGVPPKSADTFREKYTADVNAFFPSNTKVHVNDTVRFIPVGFHNVDLPKKGGKSTPAFVPGKPIAGEVDAAGQPFWFNGQPAFGFNPVLGPPGLYGKSVTYNGSKAVNSGLPLADKPKPVKVKFTKRGTFTYYCDIHPGMKGKVSVVASRASAPSSKAQAAAITRQVNRALSTAKKLAAQKPPTNAIDVGVAGSGGVERFVFAPDKITAKVGDTLTFRMSSGSYETHSATTGPGDAEKKGTYLGDIAATFEGPGPFSGAATYPSDSPAAGAAALSPASHGNGFWNSGLMEKASASPLPDKSTVRIAAPGTYQFVCLLHPFMKATVTATA